MRFDHRFHAAVAAVALLLILGVIVITLMAAEPPPPPTPVSCTVATHCDTPDQDIPLDNPARA